jgi:hypothetical protein
MISRLCNNYCLLLRNGIDQKLHINYVIPAAVDDQTNGDSTQHDHTDTDSYHYEYYPRSTIYNKHTTLIRHKTELCSRCSFVSPITVAPQLVPCLSPVCPLSIPSLSPVCPQSVPSLSPVGPLSVPCLSVCVVCEPNNSSSQMGPHEFHSTIKRSNIILHDAYHSSL